MQTYRRESVNDEGEHVAMEQRQCSVCGELYETGAILLDTRLRGVFKNRYACTGWGLCPEHQKYVDDGYVILIEASNGCDGKFMQPDEADRTGNIAFMKKEVAKDILGIEAPVAFVQLGVLDKLREMTEGCADESTL